VIIFVVVLVEVFSVSSLFLQFYKVPILLFAPAIFFLIVFVMHAIINIVFININNNESNRIESIRFDSIRDAVILLFAASRYSSVF
jgi:hypothetical protein